MGVSVPDTKENMKMCQCPGCPTFKRSPLSVGFFCAKGKAKEKVKQAGCICSSCSVFSKYKLKTDYLCVNGKSADI